MLLCIIFYSSNILDYCKLCIQHEGKTICTKKKAILMDAQSSLRKASDSLCCTHIFVLHVLEQPQLPVGSLGMDDRLEGPGQLLHCHSQTSFCVKGRTATQSNHISKLTLMNAFKSTLVLDTALQATPFLRFKLFLGILVYKPACHSKSSQFTQLLVSVENV